MDDQNVVCLCYEFSLYLLGNFREISANDDEKLNWKMFEQLLTKHMDLMPSKLEPLPVPAAIEFCPFVTCSHLLEKLAEVKSQDMALSTFFMDLITLLRYKPCLAYDFEEITFHSKELDAFRGLFALHGSDSEYMKLLLNLNLVSSLPADSPVLLDELKLQFRIFFEFGDYEARVNIHDEDRYKKVIRSKTDLAIELIQENFFRQENHKRIFLAVIALCAIQLSVHDSDPEEAISCLGIYFAATPDAFLSVFEVKSVFYVSLKVKNKLHLFDNYCQDFDKLMPECPGKMEPRRLTHLARCQVRENLSVSHLPLSAAVDKLILPKSLKKLILCEVDDTSRERRNSSQDFLTLSMLASLWP